MTDRELLERSARAAGIVDCRPVFINEIFCGLRYPTESGALRFWNPLDDDGDALRLAVKLSMEVYVDQHPDGCACTEVWSTLHPKGQESTVIINHDGDAEAATRRAIVCVAAEMAKDLA